MRKDITMTKFSYYIKWRDAGGKEQTKTYAGVAGRNYWEKKIIKELGESAILDMGKEIADSTTKKTKKFSDTEKAPLLGPIDQYHSRISEVPTGSFVISNWNPYKKAYMSRMYGSLNDILKVIECNCLKLELDAKIGKTNWQTDETKASTKQKCPNSTIICSSPLARHLVLLACLQPHVAYIFHHALPLPRSL